MEFHCNLSFDYAFFPHTGLLSINDEGPGGFRSLKLRLQQKACCEARINRHPDVHSLLASSAGIEKIVPSSFSTFVSQVILLGSSFGYFPFTVTKVSLQV